MPKPLHIRATFKGADGSLGFKQGKEYVLEIGDYLDGTETLVGDSPEKRIKVTTLLLPRPLTCIYVGVVKFLSNWDNINIVK